MTAMAGVFDSQGRSLQITCLRYGMIVSFRHAGLEAFFRTGSKAGILPSHAERLEIQLAALNAATAAAAAYLRPRVGIARAQADHVGYWTITVRANL
jgi:toxin HigB-1